MPPGRSALAAEVHDLPRLGQIEHHPVEVCFVDAVVGVADVDVVAVQDVLAEETGDVAAGSVGEVLADLVARDVGAGPEHPHRQRPAAESRLEDASTGGRCRRGSGAARCPFG